MWEAAPINILFVVNIEEIPDLLVYSEGICWVLGFKCFEAIDGYKKITLNNTSNEQQ